MRLTKISVSKSDKLTLPGVYESSGTSMTLEAEIGEGEDAATVLVQLKQQFDHLYWQLVARDFQEYLQRLQTGTANFLATKR